MAYLTVTTPFDVVAPGDGQLSLREAVQQANATATADSIRFVAALEGQTLVLTGGELAVTQDLSIDGDRNGDGVEVTVDGNSNGRIFDLAGASVSVNLKDLIVTNGQAPKGENGGAIQLRGGSLTITGGAVSNSWAWLGSGGGIFAETDSRLILSNTRINSNYTAQSTTGGGGGIAAGNNVAMDIWSSVLEHNFTDNGNDGGAILSGERNIINIENSIFSRNDANRDASGGAIMIQKSLATITRSSFSHNTALSGGALYIGESFVNILDSTIAGNIAGILYTGYGGGITISGASTVSLANSTVTNNKERGYSYGSGGGIWINANAKLHCLNNIVTGNLVSSAIGSGMDVFGIIHASNGHNIFGSTISGSVAGDRENVNANTIFAAIDAYAGGGKLSSSGIVPLKNSVANPALSGADPLAASTFGQLGSTPRPLPAGSRPDIGSIEINQPLSTGATVNNDVITGSAAANTLAGLAGNDLLKGLGGNDTINAGDGSDVLEGGPGNDKLNGGTGLDLASYAGSVAVIVDLSGTTDTAKRGGETDTLTGVENAVGSDQADTFKGDAANNAFQGGKGKDTMTGGGGRDTWDFNAVADSPVGSNRDLVRDFAPGQDVLDLAGIDADGAVLGNQAFRWVGSATLTGAAQLGYYVSGGNTIVRASTDADAAAEVEIQLTGVKVLTEGDFRP